MDRRGGFGPWLAVLAVLVVLGGAVPYGVLAGHEGWFTTLFWLAFGVAVIVVIAAGVKGWRDR
ncbi:hypothetical protein [Pararhodobacter sp. CCB-MM2]|uniref:hypothetical protein n=1 Tax=Pararhodobacter sp. CCB-MM2 TaxID=1786003 RepID=UPI0008343D5B|nr:hypothetical protein [Pararhodobacter sp. CCB-MM2]MCA2012835.1 hypothetical protein [Cereibacter sphaeroides]